MLGVVKVENKKGNSGESSVGKNSVAVTKEISFEERMSVGILMLLLLLLDMDIKGDRGTIYTTATSSPLHCHNFEEKSHLLIPPLLLLVLVSCSWPCKTF